MGGVAGSVGAFDGGAGVEGAEHGGGVDGAIGEAFGAELAEPDAVTEAAAFDADVVSDDGEFHVVAADVGWAGGDGGE